MANVKVNTISTSSGNNVAIDCALNLKNYTTTQRDALTSAAGDIYTTPQTVKYSFTMEVSWNDL